MQTYGDTHEDAHADTHADTPGDSDADSQPGTRGPPRGLRQRRAARCGTSEVPTDTSAQACAAEPRGRVLSTQGDGSRARPRRPSCGTFPRGPWPLASSAPHPRSRFRRLSGTLCA